MTGLYALYRRELAAYFQTPLAYVFLSVFALAAPGFTWQAGALFDTGRADLAPLFDYLPWLLLFLMPALAMRAWAEERDRGTLEMLLATPMSLWSAAGAKFLAAWTMAACALILTFPLWIAMNYLGAPDNGAIATGYGGALLLAGAYLALGQALSATTPNQVIAFVLGAGACFLVTITGLPFVFDMLADHLPGASAEALGELSALARFESLRRGVVTLRDVLYFLSLIGLGLTLSVTLIDARRGGGR
ncbi:ABC transporter permease [Woodsholea maritima]|uniref:ABC transporter permease n=1 Tax=Woodsholea maritima TaxID=240237 RepID=UPI00036D435C|nr:ABC transporter permease [Woodsholea maritima]